MLRYVTLVRTEVLEEPSASIIRVTRIGELGTMLAVTSPTANVPTSPFLVTLMMEAIGSSDTSVFRRATQRNIPEYGIIHSHHHENLKSYTCQAVT
jgi:hypothetical protein